MKIRVVIPYHLRTLANVSGEVSLEVPSPVTIGAIIDTLENRWPMLRGTIRDHGAHKRRALVRFFACSEDLSHETLDTPVPADVLNGKEPFIILGAIAGG